jgi:threonyl-tRNA synthetase
MPDCFGLEYIAEDGKKKRPVMLHRVVFGSVERFIGILIEHFAGALPVWLSPVQVMVLPITDNQIGYTEEVIKQLEAKGIRVESDFRNESIGRKIRDAEMQKVPYMIIIGQREAADKKIAIRRLYEGDLGASSVEELESRIEKESN